MSSDISVRTILLSTFALDGGAMHGIVPRPLWERIHTPDSRNRIPLVARSLIADNLQSGYRVLMELGAGQRWSEKERSIYSMAEGDDPPSLLQAQGIDPDTITHVLLTHLHWDHAGGLFIQNTEKIQRNSEPILSFPKAEYIVSEQSLEHARHPAEKDSGSFRAQDIEQWLRRAKIRPWREGQELLPGLQARISSAHTQGLLIPIIPQTKDGPPLAFPTDLIPTRSHLKLHWGMAYDNHPLSLAAEKRNLIGELAHMGGGVLLYHDPLIEAAWASIEEGEPILRAGRLDGTILS